MSIILRNKHTSQNSSCILTLKSLPTWDWDSQNSTEDSIIWCAFKTLFNN